MNLDRTPLVSIVLTTLNCSTYLRESINSCLDQTYRNFELIFVDGGSTDGTLETIKSYSDARIQLIHQTNNTGRLPGALNLGLDSSSGEFLTWMQGDSLYAPTAIEEMVQVLEAHPEAGQVYADFWQTDENGRIEKTIQLKEPEQFLNSVGDPAGVCFMICRSVREAIGPHNVLAYPSQDFDYRMRIAMAFKSVHIKHPLYYWRIHSQSLTGQYQWPALAHKDIETRKRLRLSNAKEALKLRAEVDIAYAFECFQNHQFRKVPPLVVSGLVRDRRYTLNLGVWSILARSLIRRYSR